MPQNSYYFAIVCGFNDSPIYELESRSVKSPGNHDEVNEEHRHLNQFIIHSALDPLEDCMKSSNSCYLKVVDRFNDWLISGYVTPGNIRMLLLHDVKSDDGIKNFFSECHQLYIKMLMNPFHQPQTPLGPMFDEKVKILAKKYL